jgi:hypothetical protein
MGPRRGESTRVIGGERRGIGGHGPLDRAEPETCGGQIAEREMRKPAVKRIAKGDGAAARNVAFHRAQLFHRLGVTTVFVRANGAAD